jgi:hypothetical protein
VTIISQPTNYSTTSSDTITISGLDTIDFGSLTTIDTMNSSTSYPSYTYSSGTVGSISISSTIPSLTTSQINSISIDTSTFQINIPEEWVNCLPDFNRIEKMCEEYPGLKIAYEKFKTTYKLVADHYDTPKDKRPKP